jgi:fructosamine-3-kinase
MTRPPDRLIHRSVCRVAPPSPYSGRVVDPGSSQVYVKRAPLAPGDYLAWEAAGLRWLGEAECDGGVPVVEVLDLAADALTLTRLQPVAPSETAAADFGRRLARMHAAGADTFGEPPEGWQGHGYFGPADAPLPLRLGRHPRWGAHLAEDRLRPISRVCRAASTLPTATCDALDEIADRCLAGEFDTADPPARIHGDLWSGNLVWTRAGVTLIDPAAHGGHREFDFAMLALFGTPHLARIIAAYDEVFPLTDGWRERQPLHQLYPLAVHAHLFGGGYAASVAAAAARVT